MKRLHSLSQERRRAFCSSVGGDLEHGEEIPSCGDDVVWSDEEAVAILALVVLGGQLEGRKWST
jgi:hypothetical protein